MQISPWTIYWVMQLDMIRGGIVALIISFLVMVVVAVAVYMEHSGVDCIKRPLDGETRDRHKKLRRSSQQVVSFCLPLFLLFGAFYVFVPSTKTMCAVLTIPTVANNETLQADLGEVYDLGMKRIKEELEE